MGRLPILLAGIVLLALSPTTEVATASQSTSQSIRSQNTKDDSPGKQSPVGTQLASPNSRQTQDEWSAKDITTSALSLLALVVSFFTAIYTYKKDASARRRSVSDDFWIRTILGPTTIQPMITAVVKCAASLPLSNAGPIDPNFADKVRSFLLQFQETHRSVVLGLALFSVLDPKLYKDTTSDLDEIEDCVIDYCAFVSGRVALGSGSVGKISRSISGDHEATKNRIVTLLVTCLRRIHGYQSDLK